MASGIILAWSANFLVSHLVLPILKLLPSSSPVLFEGQMKRIININE
jgi:hypothetical protein